MKGDMPFTFSTWGSGFVSRYSGRTPSQPSLRLLSRNLKSARATNSSVTQNRGVRAWENRSARSIIIRGHLHGWAHVQWTCGSQIIHGL